MEPATTSRRNSDNSSELMSECSSSRSSVNNDHQPPLIQSCSSFTVDGHPRPSWEMDTTTLRRVQIASTFGKATRKLLHRQFAAYYGFEHPAEDGTAMGPPICVG